MGDLTDMTADELGQLRGAIDAELDRRTRGHFEIWNGGSRRARRSPSYGAIVEDRPAIGGDREYDEWYPSLEAANAAVVKAAGGDAVAWRDGCAYYDYTARGCNPSYMRVVAIVCSPTTWTR